MCYNSADCVWYSIWLNLLDHIRLLFQCGKELESITEVFSITLGINKAKVSMSNITLIPINYYCTVRTCIVYYQLFDVFQQECGIDPSTQHDFTESTLSDPSSSSTVSLSLHSMQIITSSNDYNILYYNKNDSLNDYCIAPNILGNMELYGTLE